jgi:hypothetical protein
LLRVLGSGESGEGIWVAVLFALGAGGIVRRLTAPGAE